MNGLDLENYLLFNQFKTDLKLLVLGNDLEELMLDFEDDGKITTILHTQYAKRHGNSGRSNVQGLGCTAPRSCFSSRASIEVS